MNLIYIGDQFYLRSHSMMSSIYAVDKNGKPTKRMDWGFVQSALREGHEVHIIPANAEQMVWAYKQLEKWE